MSMQVLCARTCADGWQGLDVTEKYRMPLALLKITPHREVSDSIEQQRPDLSIEISQIFSSVSYRKINKNERRSFANRAHHRKYGCAQRRDHRMFFQALHSLGGTNKLFPSSDNFPPPRESQAKSRYFDLLYPSNSPQHFPIRCLLRRS